MVIGVNCFLRWFSLREENSPFLTCQLAEWGLSEIMHRHEYMTSHKHLISGCFHRCRRRQHRWFSRRFAYVCLHSDHEVKRTQACVMIVTKVIQHTIIYTKCWPLTNNSGYLQIETCREDHKTGVWDILLVFWLLLLRGVVRENGSWWVVDGFVLVHVGACQNLPVFGDL